MYYSKQIDKFVDYFKKFEKKREDFKIGGEFEYFIIDKNTFETISYYGDSGVGKTLKDLESKGWNGTYEGDNILGLNKGDDFVTLEPGSQIELSIAPQENIIALEKEYLKFLNDIIPILESKNQELIAVGYHPVSKIEDIKLIPKKRYDYMYDYFKTRGVRAHNMMKGTASVQAAIDYESEEDYIKKFRVANALSPVLYGIFDNGYYFEGSTWEKHGLRAYIWENCDKDRCGIIPGVFDEDFGYRKYAEYILNIPPIFIQKEGNTYPTGKKLVREIFNPDVDSIEELEHILTMVFPDVRTKKYIEIRMMDSIPYPLNFSAIALIKGLFYNIDNLDKLYEFVKDIKQQQVVKAKKELFEKGLNTTLKGYSLLEIGKYLVDLAYASLEEDEKRYIKPLKEMIEINKNPYEITKEKAPLGKKESLNWCILKNKGI